MTNAHTPMPTSHILAETRYVRGGAWQGFEIAAPRVCEWASGHSRWAERFGSRAPVWKHCWRSRDSPCTSANSRAAQHQLPAPSWAELSSPYVASNLIIKNRSCHLLPALQDILKQRCNCSGSGAPHSPNPGGQPVEFIPATL